MREVRDVNPDALTLEVPSPPRFPQIAERDIRAIAWNSCGILRSGPELEAALKMLRSRERKPLTKPSAPISNSAISISWRF